MINTIAEKVGADGSDFGHWQLLRGLLQEAGASQNAGSTPKCRELKRTACKGPQAGAERAAVM